MKRKKRNSPLHKEIQPVIERLNELIKTVNLQTEILIALNSILTNAQIGVQREEEESRFDG